MSILERVFYNLKERKIKTLLIFLTVLILGTFISSSFYIYNSNQYMKDNIRKSVSPVVLIDWLYEKDRQLIYEEDKESVIEKYRYDERVQTIENRYSIYLNNQILLHVLDEKNEEISLFNSVAFIYPNESEVIKLNGFLEPVGIDYYPISDIENGNIILKGGSVFRKDDINQGNNVVFYTAPSDSYLAEITLKEIEYFNVYVNFVFDNIENNYASDIYVKLDSPIKLEMIGHGVPRVEGTYKYHEMGNSTSGGLYIPSTLMDKLGELLVKEIKELSKEYPQISKIAGIEHTGLKYVCETYIELKDPDYLNGFVKDIKNDTNNLNNGIYVYNESYNDIKNILKNLDLISITVLTVSMISSIILLSLLIQTLVNERKYEIGIYLSLGEKKKNVIVQIVLEVLIVGILALSLSLFFGKMIGENLSTNIMDKQMEKYEELYETEFGGNLNLKKEEIIEMYNPVISLEYLIYVYSGGMFVLMVSCIIPARNILKMKPKKLLL